MFKSGFVSIVGSPNAGKSSLVNKIVDKKISIVSEKVQTTRDMIKGIYNEDNCQIVFLDTPGFHKPKDKLNRYMNEQIKESLDDIEAIVYVIDSIYGIGSKELEIIERLSTINVPRIAVINKLDLVSQEKINRMIVTLENYEFFEEILAISVKDGFNVDSVVESLKRVLPEGIQYYEDDQITDNSPYFTISEIIREKILYYTQEEVPYSVGVKLNEFENKKNALVLHATIYVERESQKGILIGKGASKLKSIGIEARKDIEKNFDKKVHLQLHVKVLKKWRNKIDLLREIGYELD